MQTPIPKNEGSRLAALKSYKILDTDPEAVYDDLTSLTASLLAVPIVLVCLIDRSRQWFKSRHGLKVPQTPREHALCAHAILSRDLMVVEDARADPRFAGNPLVHGEPHIRFYAGAPLVMEGGWCIGTLCAIDHQPRTLTKPQERGLLTLRDSVVAHLELRRATDQLGNQTNPVQCAWCQSFKGEDHARWLPAESFLLQRCNVTHGICPDCRDQFHGTIPPAPAKSIGAHIGVELLLREPIAQMIADDGSLDIATLVAINNRRLLIAKHVPVQDQLEFMRQLRESLHTNCTVAEALELIDLGLMVHFSGR